MDGIYHNLSPIQIRTLDPHFVGDIFSSRQVGLTYEGLYQYDYSANEFIVIPNLAKTLPTYSRDRRTLTIELKKGVYFQEDPAFANGKSRELTAKDVEYSIKRVADPNVNAPGYWIYEGLIEGLGKWRQSNKNNKGKKTNYEAPVSGIKVLDSHRIQIRLTRATPTFLHRLTYPNTYVVAREAVSKYGEEFGRNPVGTGPFQLDRKKSDFKTKMVWVRNPKFRNEKFQPSKSALHPELAQSIEDFRGRRLPLANGVVTHVGLEYETAWLKLMAGELDTTGLVKDQFSVAFSPNGKLSTKLQKKKIRNVRTSRMDFIGFSMNQDNRFLKNKKLRCALTAAFDSKGYNDGFFAGVGDLSQGPVPPGIAGFQAGNWNANAVYDPDRAKRLLEEAGFPGGKGLPEFRFVTFNNSFSRVVGEFFQRNMKNIGVKVRVDQVTSPRYGQISREGSADIIITHWILDYPDAENVLQLFRSDGIASGQNKARLRNARYDQMFEGLKQETNFNRRVSIIREMTKFLADDCTVIWGIHRNTQTLVNDWVKNYRVHPFENTFLKYVAVGP